VLRHRSKFDGYRVQLRVEDGAVRLKMRKGLDWTAKFAAIAGEAAAFPNCLIDGEIVALDENGAPDFAALQAALSEHKTDDLVFYAFDLLFGGSNDLRSLPLSDRKQRLQELLAEQGDRGNNALIRYVDHFATGGDAVLKSACRLSLEGIISKRLDAPYESGRSGSWMKASAAPAMKSSSVADGKFRSLLVGVYLGERFVYIGRVGTGFGEAKLRQLLRQLKAMTSDRSPFTGSGARVTGQIFTGYDRNWWPRSNFPGGPPTAWFARLLLRGCATTKPLWPDAGDADPVTKLDLARYFDAVGPWMIEHFAADPARSFVPRTALTASGSFNDMRCRVHQAC
jgi:bifunctional non-homologous end joining protein LigD